MSLEGTFETLALTEVLEVLAHSKKCGVLMVEAGVADGRIWVDAGRVVAVESGEQTGPADTPSALLNRAVDVGFALARQASGSFRFVAGEAPPFETDGHVSVGEMLEGVQRLLSEWREIQEVVPSLEARPRWRDELGADEITIDAETWQLLVGIDGRRTVRDVVHRSGRTVLEVCHTLKDLVERGAVEMVAEAEVDAIRRRVSAPRVAPVIPYGPGIDSVAPIRPHAPLGRPMEVGTGPVPIVEVPEPHLGVVVEAAEPRSPAVATGDEPAAPDVRDERDEAEEPLAPGLDDGEGGRDRRALLRLFSALRDA